jgi:hypothetical protein
MRAQKSKTGAAVTDKLIKGWPDEIAQDVFELWIGISRLMARMGGADRQLAARLNNRRCVNRPSAARAHTARLRRRA